MDRLHTARLSCRSAAVATTVVCTVMASVVSSSGAYAAPCLTEQNSYKITPGLRTHLGGRPWQTVVIAEDSSSIHSRLAASVVKQLVTERLGFSASVAGAPDAAAAAALVAAGTAHVLPFAWDADLAPASLAGTGTNGGIQVIATHGASRRGRAWHMPTRILETSPELAEAAEELLPRLSLAHWVATIAAGATATDNSSSHIAPAMWPQGVPGGAATIELAFRGTGAPVAVTSSDAPTSCSSLTAAGLSSFVCDDASVDNVTLESAWTALFDSGDPFLAYIDSDSIALSRRSMTPVRFCANDTSLATGVTLLWGGAELLLPSDLVSALATLRFSNVDFAAMRGYLATSDESSLAALGAASRLPSEPPPTVDGAACAWLRAAVARATLTPHEGGAEAIRESTALLARPAAALPLAITSVQPATGPAGGGEWVSFIGSGFALAVHELDADRQVRGRVGGADCHSMRLISSTELRCLLPSGRGTRVAVSLEIGDRVIELQSAFSYDPAVLVGIGFPFQRPVAFQGEAIFLQGEGFADTPELACQFADRHVQATYINTTHISCAVPLGVSGVISVSVTNDGERYNSGISVWEDLIVWPAGMSRAPLDFPRESAPAALHVVLMSSSDEIASLFSLQAALDRVNTNDQVLPFTTLTGSFVDTSAIASMDGQAQIDAAAVVLSSIRAEYGALLIGVVLEGPSGLSLAVQHAMRQLQETEASGGDGGLHQGSGRSSDSTAAGLATVGASSTSPLLSDAEEFPNFVRVVPSDLLQGAALANLLVHLGDELAVAGLWGNTHDTRRIAVVTFDDDEYAGELTRAFENAVERKGFLTVAIRVNLDSAIDADGRVSVRELYARLNPLSSGVGAAGVHIVLIALKFGVAVPVLDALVSLGVAQSSTLFLAPDGMMHDNAVLQHPATSNSTLLGVVPSAGRTEAAKALHASSVAATGSEAPWAPQVVDAVAALATGADSLVRQVRSPDPRRYSDVVELMAMIRRSIPPSLTDVGGFLTGTNDPRVATYDVVHAEGGNRTVVGLVDGESVTIDGEGVDPKAPVVLPWLPSASQQVNTEVEYVDIGLAYSGFNNVIGGLVEGAELAAAELNENRWLGETRVRLRVGWFSGAPDTSDADAHTIFGMENASELMPAFVGPSTSSLSVAMSPLFAAQQMPFVSPSAGRLALGSRAAHPYFLRTLAGETADYDPVVELLLHFNWTRVGTIYADDGVNGYSRNSNQVWFGNAQRAGIDVAYEGVLTAEEFAAAQNGDASGSRRVFAAARAAGIRIFVEHFLPSNFCGIAAGAVAAGAIGPDYQHTGNAWTSSTLPCHEAYDHAAISSALVGSVGAVTAIAVTESGRRLEESLRLQGIKPTDPSIIVGDAAVIAMINTRREVQAADPTYQATWDASRAYAAVMIVAHAVRQMLALNLDPSNGPLMMSNLRASKVPTATGFVEFPHPDLNDPAGSKNSVTNMVAPGTWKPVGIISNRGTVNVEGCGVGEARNLATFLCEPCEDGFYKAVVGDAACTRCPSLGDNRMDTLGVRGSTSVLACACPAGFVEPPAGRVLAPSWPCEGCPTGGICNERGLTLDRVRNRAGYWRGSPNTTFSQCPSQAHCPTSGLTLAVGHAAYRAAARVGPSFQYSTPCPVGSLPPLCSVCDSGFASSSSSGLCQPCPSRSESVAAIVVMGVAWGALATFLATQQFTRAKGRSVAGARRANAVRVFITVLQFQSFLQSFSVPWSSSLRSLFHLQSFVSTAASLVSFECLSEADATGPSVPSSAVIELVVYSSVPTIAALLFLVSTTVTRALGHFWAKPHFIHLGGRASAPRGRCCSGQREQNATHSSLIAISRGTRGAWFDHRAVADFTLSLFASVLLLVYPRLVWVTLTMFHCEDVEGSMRLRGDHSVNCDSEEYAPYHMLASVALVVWVIGWPVATTVLLAWKRRHLFVADTSLARRDTHVLVLLDDVELLGGALEAVSKREGWAKLVDVRAAASMPSQAARPTGPVHAPAKRGLPKRAVLVGSTVPRGASTLPKPLAPEPSSSVMGSTPRARDLPPVRGGSKETADRSGELAMPKRVGSAQHLAPHLSAASSPPRRWLQLVSELQAASGIVRVASRAEVARLASRRFDQLFANLVCIAGGLLKVSLPQQREEGPESRPLASVPSAIHLSRVAGFGSAAHQSTRGIGSSRSTVVMSSPSLADMPGVSFGLDEPADSAVLPNISGNAVVIGEQPAHGASPKRRPLGALGASREAGRQTASSRQRSLLAQRVVANIQRQRVVLHAAFAAVLLRTVGCGPSQATDQLSSLNESMARVIVSDMARVARNQRRYGFAYLLYRPAVSVSFALVDRARKLFMIACAVFASAWGGERQVSLGILIAVASVTVTAVVQPYARTSVYHTHLRYVPQHMRVLRRAAVQWVAALRRKAGDGAPTLFPGFDVRASGYSESRSITNRVCSCCAFRMPHEDVATENWRRTVTWASQLRREIGARLESAGTDAERSALRTEFRVRLARVSDRPRDLRRVTRSDTMLPLVAAIPEACPATRLETLALLTTVVNLAGSLLLTENASALPGDAARLSSELGIAGEGVVSVALILLNAMVMGLFGAVIACDTFAIWISRSEGWPSGGWCCPFSARLKIRSSKSQVAPVG